MISFASFGQEERGEGGLEGIVTIIFTPSRTCTHMYIHVHTRMYLYQLYVVGSLLYMLPFDWGGGFRRNSYTITYMHIRTKMY